MIRFDILSKYSGLCMHGFSEKKDGNFSFKHPRDPDLTRTSWRRASLELGFDLQHVVRPGQVHGDRILSACLEHACTPADETGILDGFDGTVTTQPGLCLTGVFADCVPVFLLDPVKKAVGLIHSGWKGTAARIVNQAILQMKLQFGCDPGDLTGVIGPCICKDCYPVSDATAQQLRAACRGQGNGFFQPADLGAWHADLAGIVKWCMMDSGMPEKRIEVSGLCTLCSKERFFSHRREGTDTGRMAAFLALVQ